MYAIVSLLDTQNDARLAALWRDLEADCRLAGVSLTPLPHFSWHIAAEYDFKRLEAGIESLAASARPFRVRTTGLGIFSGPSPVVYIPIIKDNFLAAFHKRVWDVVHPAAIGASSHYAPDVWIPHITLAYGDVDADKLSCAMDKLAFMTFNWEIEVGQLALVYALPGQVGKLQSKYPFGGETP